MHDCPIAAQQGHSAVGGAITVEQAELPVPDEFQFPRVDLEGLVGQQRQNPLQGGEEQ